MPSFLKKKISKIPGCISINYPLDKRSEKRNDVPELHPGSVDANSTRLCRVSLPRAFPVERLIALASPLLRHFPPSFSPAFSARFHTASCGKRSLPTHRRSVRNTFCDRSRGWNRFVSRSCFEFPRNPHSDPSHVRWRIRPVRNESDKRNINSMILIVGGF